LPVLTLEPRLQQTLLESARSTEGGVQLLPGPDVVERLLRTVTRINQAALEQGIRPVLVCAPQIRLPLRRLLAASVPELAIMSYSEISNNAPVVDTVGVINDERTVSV
jgi:flagellar biosynthesis protein FlhA